MTALAAQWGTAGTAALVTAADGLRLLPAGRTTDLPWLSISRLTLTLSAPEALSAADVTITGINVANYGPVNVSGSGATYTVTLAQPIGKADRVTLTVGNAGITTYTRRLDVLPGDISDDGAVTSSDLVLARNAISQPYSAQDDINGDGAVTVADYTLVRQFLGTDCPETGKGPRDARNPRPRPRPSPDDRRPSRQENRDRTRTE